MEPKGSFQRHYNLLSLGFRFLWSAVWVAEPEGAGAEFVVGFECVAFFGVHALDFDVEAQGFTRRVASGGGIGGNKQSGKSTPLWHFDLGISLDGCSPILLERRSTGIRSGRS